MSAKEIISVREWSMFSNAGKSQVLYELKLPLGQLQENSQWPWQEQFGWSGRGRNQIEEIV